MLRLDPVPLRKGDLMPSFSTLDPEFASAWEVCSPYTAASEAQGYALWQAVAYVVRENIGGCLIECGVRKCGSAMLMALAAKNFGWSGNLILFGTFRGAFDPDQHEETDVKDVFERSSIMCGDATEAEDIRVNSQLEEVRLNLAKVKNDNLRTILIEGPVEETLLSTQTGQIALLRLDTPLYSGMAGGMEILYPKLSQGGILILEDYGQSADVRKAVDEYFNQMAPGSSPFMAPVGLAARIMVRPPTSRKLARDFLPKGFDDLNLLKAFPTLVAGDTSQVKWPWLRRNSPHIWRTDSRSMRAHIGVLSYEEAAILYNFGRSMAGRRGLEIGCHLAWSTVHLIAAGLDLDVIDPALGDPQHEQYVRDSITAATGTDGLARTHLHPGFSPGLIDLARARKEEPWSLAFVDGFHDKGAPLRDVKAVAPHMAEDAMIFFHDLICPDVHEAVAYMNDCKWNIGIFNTSQVMAIAWRGEVQMPRYSPDPHMPPPAGAHLEMWREQWIAE